MDVTASDRDATVRRLHLAAADGQLTFDEAEHRIAAARGAASPAELAALVVDLGSSVVPASMQDQFEPYPTGPASISTGLIQAVVEPGYSPRDPLILSAGWEGTKRTGQWRVPPFIRANSGIDSVKLNCLLAQHTTPVIDLEVTAGAGSVKLIVPEGWGVQIDRLTKSFGSAKSSVSPVPAPGFPLVVVHGSVGLGSFRARHANWFERWQLKRQGLELPPVPSRELR